MISAEDSAILEGQAKEAAAAVLKDIPSYDELTKVLSSGDFATVLSAVLQMDGSSKKETDHIAYGAVEWQRRYVASAKHMLEFLKAASGVSSVLLQAASNKLLEEEMHYRSMDGDPSLVKPDWVKALLVDSDNMSLHSYQLVPLKHARQVGINYDYEAYIADVEYTFIN